MKVVHICNLPLPPEHPDQGRLPRHPGRWPLNLAMAQRRHAAVAAECVVVTAGASGAFRADIDGVPVHYVPAARRFRATTLFIREVVRTARFVRRLKPDLVHAHGSEDSNLLVALATGLPVVFTAQTLFFQLRAREPLPLICRERVTGLLESFALRRTRFAVGKSEYVAAGLEARYPQLHVSRIPNPIDESLLEVPLAAARRDAIAFVGTVVHRKGTDLIAAALERALPEAPSLELVIMGNVESPGAFEREVLARLRGLLDDRLRLLGVVPPRRVISELSSCRALVAPSREEMYGNQVVEALIAGTHAIVTAGTGMAETVERFGNGTVIPQQDPAALADALREALARPVGVDAEVARNRVREALAPGRIAGLHEALYRKVLLQS